MVTGIRSPPSRTRSMTNCPARADIAMSGASRRKSFVTGVSRRVSTILVIPFSLEVRARVHRLEPLPPAVGLGLDAPHDLRVRRREEMTGLPHGPEPVGDRSAAAGRVGVVRESGLAALDLVEREEARIHRGLEDRLRSVVVGL